MHRDAIERRKKKTLNRSVERSIEVEIDFRIYRWTLIENSGGGRSCHFSLFRSKSTQLFQRSAQQSSKSTWKLGIVLCRDANHFGLTREEKRKKKRNWKLFDHLSEGHFSIYIVIRSRNDSVMINVGSFTAANKFDLMNPFLSIWSN